MDCGRVDQHLEGPTTQQKGICLLWNSERLSQEASGCLGRRRVLIPALVLLQNILAYHSLPDHTHVCVSWHGSMVEQL